MVGGKEMDMDDQRSISLFLLQSIGKLVVLVARKTAGQVILQLRDKGFGIIRKVLFFSKSEHPTIEVFPVFLESLVTPV